MYVRIDRNRVTLGSVYYIRCSIISIESLKCMSYCNNLLKVSRSIKLFLGGHGKLANIWFPIIMMQNIITYLVQVL